jgi:hypothetical protein
MLIAFDFVGVSSSSSNEESDVSSIFEFEVKRTKKVNYLVGHGEPKWFPTQEVSLHKSIYIAA